MSTQLSPRCEHRRGRLGLALPTMSPAQLHMRSSGHGCAGSQLYVFSSCSGLRRNGRFTAGRCDSGRTAQCQKATFPRNC